MDEKLRALIAEFEKAFATAHDLRSQILEYAEEITNIDMYDISSAVKDDCMYIYEIDQERLEELIEESRG